MVPQKESKQQRMSKGKWRASSMKSKEAEHSTKRAPSNLESPVGVGWCGGTLELLHQGVPERLRPLRGSGSRATSLVAQGYGRPEEHKATGSLYVLEEGLSFGQFLNLVPLILCYSFCLLISWSVFVAFV